MDAVDFDAMTQDHEGKRIKHLLDERGKTVQNLADAAEYSWAGAKLWIKSEKLGQKARENASTGLKKLGIDPRLVWSVADGQPATERVGEFKQALGDEKVWSADHLQLLRKILLECDRTEQFRLVEFIEGLLFRSHR